MVIGCVIVAGIPAVARVIAINSSRVPLPEAGELQDPRLVIAELVVTTVGVTSPFASGFAPTYRLPTPLTVIHFAGRFVDVVKYGVPVQPAKLHWVLDVVSVPSQFIS